jgi:hypothetical protein
MLFLKIFQVILIDFVTKNKKEYKKEYKEYNFGVKRVHPFFVLDACTLLLFFVLEKSGHPGRVIFSTKKKKEATYFCMNLLIFSFVYKEQGEIFQKERKSEN